MIFPFLISILIQFMNRIPIKDQLLNKQIISYQTDGNIKADTQIQKYRHGDQRDTTP